MEQPGIPKQIHYCWYGDRRQCPSIFYNKCLPSWHKHYPDFEIIEWNEHNTPFYQIPELKLALERKQYALISDMMRLYILYKYGGIYFDIDLEVYRRSEKLIDRAGYISEYIHGYLGQTIIDSGCLSSAGGNIKYKEAFDAVREYTRTYDQGTSYTYACTMMPITSRALTSDRSAIKIYWNDLSATNREIPNADMIHHYTASWVK